MKDYVLVLPLIELFDDALGNGHHPEKLVRFKKHVESTGLQGYSFGHDYFQFTDDELEKTDLKYYSCYGMQDGADEVFEPRDVMIYRHIETGELVILFDHKLLNEI